MDMSPPDANPDERLLQLAHRVLDPLCRYFDASLEGLEHLPEDGPVLLVGNHALLGIDSLVLLTELHAQTGRVPRGMALRSLFAVPGLRRLMRGFGAVEGSRDNAIGLLDDGEMVVAYPGGARDSIKSRSERYQLQWEGRLGFAYVALAAGAPIVPVAAIGPDEVFPMLTERGLVPAHFLGDASYRVPPFLPIARPVPFTFIFGEPIDAPQVDWQPDGRSHRLTRAMKQDCREHARTVQHALEVLIEQGREAREPRRGGRLWSLLGELLGAGGE